METGNVLELVDSEVVSRSFNAVRDPAGNRTKLPRPARRPRSGGYSRFVIRYAGMSGPAKQAGAQLRRLVPTRDGEPSLAAARLLVTRQVSSDRRRLPWVDISGA